MLKHAAATEFCWRDVLNSCPWQFKAPKARYGRPGNVATILKLRSAAAEALASAILGEHFPPGQEFSIIDLVVGDAEELLHDSDVFEDVCYSQLQTDQYVSEGRQKFAALYQAALDIWNTDSVARQQAIAIVRARCEEAIDREGGGTVTAPSETGSIRWSRSPLKSQPHLRGRTQLGRLVGGNYLEVELELMIDAALAQYFVCQMS